MDLFDAIHTRRSIRAYTDAPVSEADLDTLLRAAMAAPSAGNAQPWHFVVVTDRAVLAAIPDIHPHAAMYTKNARLRGWWEEVHLLVWGPAADLLSYDTELQAAVAACREAGVEVFACRACAEHYGVDQKLAALGIEVLYAGEPLTGYLKDGWKVLTI